jgi:hypothetical protein
MTAHTIENISPSGYHRSEVVAGRKIRSVMGVFDIHTKVTAEIVPDQSRSGSWEGCYDKFFIKHIPFMAGAP